MGTDKKVKVTTVTVRNIDKNLWLKMKTQSMLAEKTIAEWLGEAILEKMEREKEEGN